MDFNILKETLSAGLPIWILAMGGLLGMVLDATRTSWKKEGVFGITIGSMGAALVLSFQFWSREIYTNQSLLLMDRLTWFFVVLVVFVSLLSVLNLWSYLKGSKNFEFAGTFFCLILFAVVGQIFLFASNHLIVNFIGLETFSLALYILVGADRDDVKSNEASMKYFVMGSVASAVLLFGLALLYASFGTMDLSQMKTAGLPGLSLIGGALVLVGVLFKIAAAPFHFWVPDVYEGAPAPVTGFMATSVKIAAFAFFIRILTAFDFLPADTVKSILSICVILTLIVGNLGALVQENVKRMLAYSSIAHAGYALLGLLVAFGPNGFDPAITSAVLFYLMGYSFMTLGAFAFLSLLVKDGHERSDYSELAGLGNQRPVLALAFSLFLLSLIGIPVTVGFTAKYGIFRFAIQNGYVYLAILGLVLSVVSVAYYLKPVVQMYFKDGDAPREYSISFPVFFTLVFCAIAVIYLGLFPSDYLEMAEIATSSLTR